MSSKGPFRGDLEAAQRRIERLTADYEARIAGLQEENARLRHRLIDGDPKRQRERPPRIAIALAVVTTVLAVLAIYYLASAHKSFAPQPVVIVESPPPPPTKSTHTPPELSEADRRRVQQIIADEKMRRRDALPTCKCEAGDPLCAEIPGVTCAARP